MTAESIVLQGTTTTSDGVMNASSGFASSTELMPMIGLVVYLFVAIGILRVVAPQLAKSQWLSRAGATVAEAIVYAAKGLIATVALSILASPVYLLATTDASTRTAAGKWVGIGLAAFAVLVLIGMAADRVVQRYVAAHPEAETFDDLLPEPGESGQEAEPDAGGEAA